MSITFALIPLPDSVIWLHLTAEEAGKCSPAVLAGRKEMRFVELLANICHSVFPRILCFICKYTQLLQPGNVNFNGGFIPMILYYLNLPGNKIYYKTDGL